MKPRSAILALLAAGCLAGQQASREVETYVYDGMGNRTLATTSSTIRRGDTVMNVERVRSINGREVPLESVQERVVSASGGVKVIERIVRRYGADGQPGPPEKIRIEERTAEDGAITTSASVYRGDLNGAFHLAERSVEHIRKAGDVTMVTRSLEKPTLNATLEMVERSTRTTSEKDGASHSESVVYRRDASGAFYAAAQEVADRRESQGAVSETVTVYEAVPGGKMQFSNRMVSTLQREADGSELRQTDVYSVVVAGRVSLAGQGRPELRERQILERKAASGGAVVEILSVRRPSLSDPDRLGPAQKVSEVICRGCEPPGKP